MNNPFKGKYVIIAQTSRYIWEGSVVEFGAPQGGRSGGTTGLVVAACAEPLALDMEPQHTEFCCNLHTFVELSITHFLRRTKHSFIIIREVLILTLSIFIAM